jgi:hypothetical protein
MKGFIRILSCIYVLGTCTFIPAGAQDYLDRVWVLGDRHDSIIPFTSLFTFSDDTFTLSPVYREQIFNFGATNTLASREGPELWAFTNGCNMYNSKYEVMLNGDSIVAGQLYKSYCFETKGWGPYIMGAILVPWPGTSDSLILFNLNLDVIYDDDTFIIIGPSLLNYSIIDMSLDDGFGAVVEKRQIAIADTMARGHVLAVQHGNGSDWWIVVPRSHSDCYYSLPVTSEGIGNPVYTCSGMYWGDGDMIGQATFSPNRTRYARVNLPGGLHIFEFDDLTGEMTYLKGHDFADETSTFAGTCFSPTGRFLYATTRNRLYQFDMEADDFEGSRVLIAERDPVFKDPFTARFYISILAPDGRIYIAPSGQFNYLQSILSPDCPGQACHFVQNHIKMIGSGFDCLPNLPFFRDWSAASGCDTTTHVVTPYDPDEVVTIYPNPVTDYLFVRQQNPLPNSQSMIYDLSGRLVHSREMNEALDTGIFMGHLASGMYFFHLKDATGKIIYSAPFIKVED